MKYVYLDYAAGTSANISSIHSSGVKAKKDLQTARKTIADILNCHDYEIYFIPNSTYSIATALNFDTDTCDSNVVITSNIEHKAVLDNLNKNKTNIILKVEESGILKVSTLRETFNKIDETNAFTENINIEKTKNKEKILVTIMYANNEIGTIQKSKEYGRIIDEYNRKNNLDANNRVLYHIDASQASNYLDLDVRKLRCDMLTLNSSKCYGPNGIALLYIKEDIRHRVSPLLHGGDQERGMYSGTENVEGAIGFAQALQYAQSIKEEESLRLLAIRDSFIQMYADEMWERRSCHSTPTPTPNPSPRFGEGDHSENQKSSSCASCVCGERLLYGSNEINERLPNNINIRVPGIPSDEMVIRLDQKGFAVSHRSACAAAGRTRTEEGRRRATNDSNITNDDGYVLKAIGASDEESNENIRISMGQSTTMEDMMNLLTAILEIYDKYSII